MANSSPYDLFFFLATVHKKRNSEVMHIHFSSKQPSLKLVIMLGVGVGGDAHQSFTLKDDQNSLASISLTLPRMWLWLCVYMCVCLYVCVQHFIPTVVVHYFWELCSLLTFKATGNGKWFAILETHAEVRRVFFFFAMQRSHCEKRLKGQTHYCTVLSLTKA